MSRIRGTVGDVDRVHTDRGGEFLNLFLCRYPREQQVWQTTTQSYDPDSNGLAGAYGGIMKQ